MRRFAAIACTVAIAATTASADSLDSRGERPFWSWVIAPNAVEVGVVLEKVEENRQAINRATSEVDYLEIRRRALDDALGMLRYALRLEPEDRTLLRVYGEVAADRGLLAEAAGALERYLDGDDRPEDNPTRGLLGQIYAQQGRFGEAIPLLRAGIASHSRSAIHSLASVYMERGRIAEAIDLLEHAPQSHELMLALAVAYDRDEQIGLAAETLEKLTSMLGGTGAQLGTLPDGIGVIYAPAIDQRYFAALLYEAAGHLPESRAEWMAYARAHPAPRYRRRALEHVAAIDQMIGAKR